MNIRRATITAGKEIRLSLECGNATEPLRLAMTCDAAMALHLSAALKSAVHHAAGAGLPLFDPKAGPAAPGSPDPVAVATSSSMPLPAFSESQPNNPS